jgi:protein gp37
MSDLIERGVDLAQRGNTLAWEWARWSWDVGGPIGEDGRRTGAKRQIADAREQVLRSTTVDVKVPEIDSLMAYREAAEAVPDRAREGQISVRAARELYKAEPFERERILATFNGDKITAAAITDLIAELRQADVPETEPEPEAPTEEFPQKEQLFEAEEESPPPAPKPKPPPTFNQVNDNIGWARWSWNPVTGCLHNCAYCYARDIANRFYEQGFEPTFLPERLTAPQHTTVPAKAEDDPAWRRVFTCSMADLFGKWVPQEWIDAVFEQIVAAPQWEFLCLTKFPQRLAELDWPENVWAGTTVDKQHRVDLAQRHFAEVKAGVKWLSCEPLLEPLKFDSLEMFDWVVIGSCTSSSGAPAFAPPWDWVVDLYQQARDAGCRVFLKHNLREQEPGMQMVREWPR